MLCSLRNDSSDSSGHYLLERLVTDLSLSQSFHIALRMLMVNTFIQSNSCLKEYLLSRVPLNQNKTI